MLLERLEERVLLSGALTNEDVLALANTIAGGGVSAAPLQAGSEASTAPPTLFITPVELARMKAGVLANTPEWQALRAKAESYMHGTVHYPDAGANGDVGMPMPPGSTGTNTDEPFISSYQGEVYMDMAYPLALCYLVTEGTSYSPANRAMMGQRLEELAEVIAAPSPIAKVPITCSSFTVSGGLGTITNPSYNPRTTAGYNQMYIRVEGTGDPTLDGMRRITTTTASTIVISVPSAADGTYTATLGVANYVSTFLTPKRIKSVTAGSATQLVFYSWDYTLNLKPKTGDLIILSGYTGAWAALNGTFPLTVIDASSNKISIPVNTAGLGVCPDVNTTAFLPGHQGLLEVRGNGDNAYKPIFSAGRTIVMEGWVGEPELNGTFLVDYLAGSGSLSGSTLTWAAGDNFASRLTGRSIVLNVGGTNKTFTATYVSPTQLTLSGGTMPATGTYSFTYDGSTATNFYLMKGDKTPVTFEHGPTNYNYLTFANTTYNIRNYGPMMAVLYSWGYTALDTTAKQELIDKVNLCFDDLWRVDTQYSHPGDNFFAGAWAAAAMDNVVFAHDNPRQAETVGAWFNMKWNGPSFLREYFNRWMPLGADPQGHWAYGDTATKNLILGTLAMLADGTDLTANGNWLWPNGEINYLFSFLAPSGTELEGANYNRWIQANADDVARVTGSITGPLAYWAVQTGNPQAAEMVDYFRDTQQAIADSIAQGVTPTTTSDWQETEWMSFLFNTSSVTPVDWQADQPLTGYAFNGSFAVSRTDWSPTASYITFESMIEVDNSSNGKCQYEAGAVTMRKGRVPLVTYPIEEYARSAPDQATWERMSADNFSTSNAMGNVWWVEAPGGKNGGQAYSDQYQTTVNTVPAVNRTIVPARMPSISRSEDEGAYVYWMGSDIQAVYNTKSSVDNLLHASSWDRQVVFLRDLGVSVVYDRTKALNSTDDSYMTFCVPAAPQAASVGAGMARYNVVSPDDGFSGALTFILPPGATTRVRNWRSEGITYQIDALAPAGQANDYRLITVLDTAGSESQLNVLTPVTGAGIQGTQVGSSAMVGFVTSATPAFPLGYTLPGTGAVTSYISGLTPGVAYKVTTSGRNISINTSGEGVTLTASPAGVLTVTTATYLPGDANRDGSVKFADYLILEQNFGKSGKTWADGDFTGDGNVKFADYLLLEQNFGKSNMPLAPVPAMAPIAATVAVPTKLASTPTTWAEASRSMQASTLAMMSWKAKAAGPAKAIKLFRLGDLSASQTGPSLTIDLLALHRPM